MVHAELEPPPQNQFDTISGNESHRKIRKKKKKKKVKVLRDNSESMAMQYKTVDSLMPTMTAETDNTAFATRPASSRPLNVVNETGESP